MTTLSATQIKAFLNQASLPVFITRKNKYQVGVLLGVFATFLYLFSNHFHFFEPRLLPLSWIDSAIPFIPETVWIYASEWTFFIVVYITCKDMFNLNRYFYSFLGLQIASVLVFCVWPTTYPRDLFPLPDQLNSATYYLFNTLRITDTPANCCPSLHVSSVYLSTFLFLEEQREKFPWFFLWGTAIALSTLTTKQHYLIDVVMGLIMAITTYWIFYKNATYRTTDSTQGR